MSPRSVSYRTYQEYEASDREFRQTELNMDKDDSISPTLPTFDMRTRVSRDQTEIRAPSPSSSSTSTSSSSLGSMPIILEMRPGETILESHDDAMRREHSFGTASKDPRGGAAAGRSSRYRSRPASLATTLRPRRASTGAGLSDWISMYDPQTPTAIVDLERMASGFPLIPQGVDEEEDVEDGLSGGTSRVAGLPRGLDHDRLDSITSWQRDCCELKRFLSECLIIGEIPPVTRASLFSLSPCRAPFVVATSATVDDHLKPNQTCTSETTQRPCDDRFHQSISLRSNLSPAHPLPSRSVLSPTLDR